MNSLHRMMAAIRGEPFDVYPYVNPYPSWSMMPHWPELLGVTFLHESHGSDELRLRCLETCYSKVGLDWISIPDGPAGQDKRFRIETDMGLPVLVDKTTGTKKRYDELPRYEPPSKPKFNSAGEVTSLPPPPTADEIVAGDTLDMAKKVVNQFGESVFLFDGNSAPFARCYYDLGFEKLFDALVFDHDLLFALLEYHTELLIQRAKALAHIGVHSMRFHEFFCSAEMLSEQDYIRFAFPYEQKLLHALREEGLISILEFLGSVEPRLPHIARLEPDCLQTESSLKGYQNEVATFRRVLGDSVCIFGNSPILQVIEQGTREDWLRDALEQARGIGKEQRFVICAGSPTTWATSPDRLRRFGESTRGVLAEIAPPRNGRHPNG